MQCFPGQDPRTSISHSEGIVACAASDEGRIGIDVEWQNPNRAWAAIAAEYFGPGEANRVLSGGAETFYRLWTLKEALGKAEGTGLARVLERSDWFAACPLLGEWRMEIAGRIWTFQSIVPAPDYVLALAAEGADPRISRLDI